MKTPEKRDRIAEDLAAKIVVGALPSGSRLPSEQKLAEALKVSRDTVRSALLVLENRALIERIPGRGTFVRQLRESNPEQVITFLLPCAEILADRIGYRAAMVTRELLCGAICEAGKRQLRVETVAVSPSNRNDDIDWLSLRHLSRSSRVIAYSAWYAPLFDFLRGQGVRTALVTLGKENLMPLGPGLTERSFRLHDDSLILARTAANFLRGELDCRRIALIGTPHEGMPCIREHFDFCVPMPHPERVFHRSAADDREFRSALRRLHEHHRFDGVLLSAPYLHEYDYTAGLNDNLGLPSGVRVLLWLHNPYEAVRNAVCLTYDFREVGAQAVRALSGGSLPGELIFDPTVQPST